MFGPYRLEEIVGRGGMGEVYRAYDTEHHRSVAVKRLAADLSRDADFQERFRREAHNVAQLRNPHVVPLHRHGSIDGQLYIDMRLIDGGDLEDLIGSGPVAVERAVLILEQVAGALDEAHALGMVHRDVKPSNILVDGQVADFCYLTDFGIASHMASEQGRPLTQSGAVVGSLAYTAPEQFDGVATPRSDVYALTCVFFEMLTGRRPFVGETLPALMHAHRNVTSPRPSTLVPSAGIFDDVVAVGLAKDPALRFSSAGQLAQAARSALRAAQDSGGRPSEPAPGSPPGLPPDDTAATGERAAPAARAETAGAVDADARTRPRAGAAAAPEARAGRTWIRPVVAVVAAVGLIAATWFVAHRDFSGATASAPSDTRATTDVAASAQPGAAAPIASGAAAPPPAPVTGEGFFTGHIDGDRAFGVAIGFKDGRATGYLCDGKAVEAWLDGTIVGNHLTLHGSAASGAQLTADLDQDSLRGEVVLGSVTRTFTAPKVVGKAGLYQSRRTIKGITSRIGWIVLPDGSQVGILNVNGTRSPAPGLDLASLTAAEDGEAFPAQRVEDGEQVLGG